MPSQKQSSCPFYFDAGHYSWLSACEMRFASKKLLQWRPKGKWRLLQSGQPGLYISDPLSSLFWCLETFHWKEWPRNSNYHPLILFCFPSLRFFSGTHFIDHIVLLSIKFLFLSTSMAPKHSNAALLPNYFDWSRFALRFQPKNIEVAKWHSLMLT